MRSFSHSWTNSCFRFDCSSFFNSYRGNLLSGFFEQFSAAIPFIKVVLFMSFYLVSPRGFCIVLLLTCWNNFSDKLGGNISRRTLSITRVFTVRSSREIRSQRIILLRVMIFTSLNLECSMEFSRVSSFQIILLEKCITFPAYRWEQTVSIVNKLLMSLQACTPRKSTSIAKYVTALTPF